MKKMMSRLVLALLVVALVCAMIPAAFADSALTLSKTTEKVLVGESVSFPSATYSGAAVEVTWKQGENPVTTPTTSAAGTTVYTASYTPDGEGATSVTATFTVTVVSATVVSYTNPTVVTAVVGTEKSALTLPGSVTANFGEGLTKTYGVSWACETYNKDTAGTYTFTGTVTLPNGVTAEGVAAPTVSVTLANKPTITISAQPGDTKIKKDTLASPAPALAVTATAKGSDGTTALTDLKYQWKVSDTLNGTYTAINGETGSGLTLPKSTVGVKYYKCEISVTESATGLTTKLESAAAKVEVCSAYQITLNSTNKDKTIVVGTDSTITATVKEFDETTKEYKTTNAHNKLNWSINVNKKYAALSYVTTGNQLNATLYTEGVSTTSGDKVIVTATIDSTEYSGTAEFKVVPGTAQDITYRAYSGGASFSASDFMSAVKYAANDLTMEYVLFSVSSSDGKLYKTSSMTSEVSSTTECAYDAIGSQADLDDLYFVPKNLTKSEISYVAYNSDDAIIATGKVVVSATYGDIEYTTSAGQSVTFDEDDFDKFFRSEYTNGDLDYVVFDVSYDDDLDTRTYGYLYETSKGTSLVGKRDKYYFEASASQTDLDAVTFTAGTYTKKYALTIPFTAYGEDRNGRDKELSGYVTLTVNDGSSASIYSIGTSFEKLYDAMIPEGYTTTSSLRSLCVVFDTVTNGRLFYDYDTIADASVVDLDDDVFCFSATGKNDLDLEEVYFVPAAGATSAKITYTIYDGNTKVDSGSLTFSIVQQTKSNYFSDVTASTNGTWSANAIDFMSYNELVTGTSSKAFSPNMTMNRAMLVTILYRIEGQPSVNITNPFTDVKKGSYYYDAVLWAYKNDIVTGTTKTTFSPDGAVTREQIAAILYRYAGSPKTSGTLTGYTDRGKVSTYAETALAWAVKNGVITSKSSSVLKLDPAGKGTRAEVAVMLHRYLTK